MLNNCNHSILFWLEHRFRNSTTQSNRNWFNCQIGQIIKYNNQIAIENVIIERIKKHEPQN